MAYICRARPRVYCSIHSRHAVYTLPLLMVILLSEVTCVYKIYWVIGSYNATPQHNWELYRHTESHCHTACRALTPLPCTHAHTNTAQQTQTLTQTPLKSQVKFMADLCSRCQSTLNLHGWLSRGYSPLANSLWAPHTHPQIHTTHTHI